MKDYTMLSLCKLTFAIFVISSIPSVLACGPGRGGIRRRGARKLTPLVYKQHEPNFSERSLAASGLPDGLIDRSSDKFRHLVPNYNPDILFKDEELTGADRLMTPRCKEKLNTLAISVMNQWPGIQLRVTEAWDEDFHHAEQSLHYEGRAVDLTTSDRDRTKYGLLARLAVESGFDWVYYESRAHIHASCKSEASHPSKNGGCFKGTSTVMTLTGSRKSMAELEVGDVILTVTSDGQFQFSPVILFLDRDVTKRRQFYVIETESGTTLTVTPSHLVYADILEQDNDISANDINNENSFENFEAVYASRVREGDYILVQKNGRMVPSRVASIETKIFSGVFAPLTASGNIVVDGALASCYAILENQSVSHAAFAPFRWSHAVKGWLNFDTLKDITQSGASQTVRSSKDSLISERTEGIHWYADMLYSLAKYVMPKAIMLR